MKTRLLSAVKKGEKLQEQLEGMLRTLERQGLYDRDLFDDLLYAKDRVIEATNALRIRAT